MSQTHTIDPTRIHHRWDNRYAPALTVASGDVIEYDLLMCGHGQCHEGASFGGSCDVFVGHFTRSGSGGQSPDSVSIASAINAAAL